MPKSRPIDRIKRSQQDIAAKSKVPAFRPPTTESEAQEAIPLFEEILMQRLAVAEASLKACWKEPETRQQATVLLRRAATHYLLCQFLEAWKRALAQPRPSYRDTFSQALTAAQTASFTEAIRLGLTHFLEFYLPGKGEPTPEEAAMEFLTGWAASEKMDYVRRGVSRQAPKDIEAATLLELYSTVAQIIPELTFETFQELPRLARGRTARINQTEADRLKSKRAEPIRHRLEEESRHLAELTENSLRSFETRESLRSRAKEVLTPREYEWFSLVDSDPEKYGDPYGGHIAVAEATGWSRTNARQIASTARKKLGL